MRRKNYNNKVLDTYGKYYQKYSYRIINAGGCENERLEAVYLEERFSNLTLSLILEFENKLIKDFSRYLDDNAIGRNLYTDTNNFSTWTNTRTNQGRIRYNNLIENLLKELVKVRKVSVPNNYRIGNNVNNDLSKINNMDIEKILFYCSFGTVKSFLRSLDINIIEAFADSYVLSNHNSFHLHSFFRFLEMVRKIRNRCAHSNQILSSHLRNEMTGSLNIHINETRYKVLGNTMLNTLDFLLNNVSYESKVSFKKKYIQLFRTHKYLINKYRTVLYLKHDIYKKMRNI